MMNSNRRTFLKATGAFGVMAATRIAPSTGCLATKTSGNGGNEPSWYRNAWRRAVIDMHIPDWDERFLSEFDPRQYADMLERSRAQSIVCYCQSHVGLFNYPTEIGKQHEAFEGRDVLQEMIDACHAKGIAVVLYCSLIFDRWCGDTHPEWRMRRPDGEIHGLGDRHCVMCVNSPYREYVRQFTEEVCGRFDFEGIRFDMTFWPWLCFCRHCQARFDREVGGEIPKTIDWLDDRWVGFQRMRERSIVDFAEMATGTVKRLKPHVSVEHQSSTYPLNWMFGVTESLAEQNDFLQGDFYGDQLQGSFVRKLLENLTPNRPFGYETSFSRELKDHTSMKSEALLAAKASAAIADGAAFIFIDAIDPVGTVNHRAHERMGDIFDRLMPYYDHLGGERIADVAVFYSTESKFNMRSNGGSVNSPDTSDTHTASTMQVASRLIQQHVPFGVVTKRTLDQLDNYKVLILSNVHLMDEEECDAIRDWVRRGGKLLATGGSSLVDKSGSQREDFMLSNVYGVSVVNADWSERVHYLSPTGTGQVVFPEYNSKYPVYCAGQGFQVQAHEGTEVLATTGLTWERNDKSRFSSIHSDPPWRQTDQPEITRCSFGDGEAIYCASLVENLENAHDALVSLVRMLTPVFSFEVEAPRCVEATLFRQSDRGRYLLSLLNFQKELPNLPIENIRIRLRVPETVTQVRLVTGGEPIEFSQVNGQVSFTSGRLETLAMIEVVWE